MTVTDAGLASPYLHFDHAAWSRLADSTPLPLTESEVARLTSVGDVIGLTEADSIYRPLSALLNLHAHASQYLHRVRGTFLRDETSRTPYVIGLAGSVAAGKSTVARLLVELLARWSNTPSVELLPTDGFLYPNHVLQERGLMERKGFPESYDRRALLDFLAQVKSGAPEVAAPRYSHLLYDIMPGEYNIIRQPDILVVEGLNVLQAARTSERGGTELVVSDFFDFSIYIDAAVQDLRQWYVERFLALRDTAFNDPASYFHRYANMSGEQAAAYALDVWDRVNGPNLIHNIVPTRGRADLIMSKGHDHRVDGLYLRKT